MLDMKLIRENPEKVKQGLANKNDKTDIDKILELDNKRREIIREVEKLKADRNQATAEIAKKKQAGENADDAIKAMRDLGDNISGLDNDLREIDEKIRNILIWIPNLPHESVPIGNESCNKVIKEWGEIKKSGFNVLPHWEVAEKLGILDMEAAAKISGSGFYMLKGLGAKLNRALINFMLDTHISNGFTEIAAPFIVLDDTMFGTGQLPKLADDMYKTTEDNMYLIPTAEVSITNIYKQSMLNYKELPVYMVGYSPCFRREAGAAGKDTRGMLRVHQFDKVEMVKIVEPEKSYDELETLLQQAEKIIQAMEIPYRVSALASADLSFAAAKCYDIEIWSAGIERYLEVSSVSNFEDFQARRMNCRFKDEEKRTQFPHTLNGSGVALPRLLSAIMENHQNEDGTINIPKALRPFMGGIEKIG